MPRVAFAGALTAVLLAAVGAVGGVGYAASTVQDAVKAVKHAGMRVLAADIAGDDLPTLRDRLGEPTAWLFGNEAHGLTDESLTLADAVVKVPIYGHAESLNLATAASVCLYESAFAQRA